VSTENRQKIANKAQKNAQRREKQIDSAPSLRLHLAIMMVAERLDWILRQLQQERRLTIDQAVQELGVSADTVRRDFDRLAARNQVRRTHGGIVSVETGDTWAPYSSFKQRASEREDQKRRIARAALDLVQAGETLAVDAGSTSFHLARILGGVSCTVLAYSLEIAAAVLEHENVQLFVSGGLVRRETQSAVGEESISMLRRFQASTAFIGANAINTECEVMTPNHMEAAVKRVLIEISDRTVLLADSSKIGRRALSRFADVGEFAVMITDSDIDPEAARGIRARGVELIVV
jgi:DeoR family fructose operon transcriptional repressor